MSKSLLEPTAPHYAGCTLVDIARWHVAAEVNGANEAIKPINIIEWPCTSLHHSHSLEFQSLDGSFEQSQAMPVNMLVQY